MMFQGALGLFSPLGSMESRKQKVSRYTELRCSHRAHSLRSVHSARKPTITQCHFKDRLGKVDGETHMDVSLHVKVDAVLDHQRLERLLTGQADIARAVLDADVPRPMETDDHPGRLFAINRG